MDIKPERAQGWPNMDPPPDQQDFPSDTFEYFARVFGCSVEDLRNEQPWTGLDRAEAPISDGKAEKPECRVFLIDSGGRKAIRKRTNKAVAELKPEVMRFWEVHGSGLAPVSLGGLANAAVYGLPAVFTDAADGIEKRMSFFDSQQTAALLTFAFEYCVARIDAIEQMKPLSSEAAQALVTKLESKAFGPCLQLLLETALASGVSYVIHLNFRAIEAQGLIPWPRAQLSTKLRAKLYALSQIGSAVERLKLERRALADQFKLRHGLSSDAAIYTEKPGYRPGFRKSDFYGWLTGKLPPSSSRTHTIENHLRCGNGPPAQD